MKKLMLVTLMLAVATPAFASGWRPKSDPYATCFVNAQKQAKQQTLDEGLAPLKFTTIVYNGETLITAVYDANDPYFIRMNELLIQFGNECACKYNKPTCGVYA